MNMELSVIKESPITLQVDHISTFSLAAQQNSYPLFRNIRLNYPAIDGEFTEDLVPLRNLVITLTTASDLFTPEEWPVDEIRSGQTITLQQRPLNIPHKILFELTEEMQLGVVLTVTTSYDPDIVYLRKNISITVLPANFWGGESRQPDLLAAFVKPNGIYVESLVRQVTEVLEKAGHGRSADGYQSNTREKPYMMTAALWNVIFAQRIAYVTPPQSFARQGQRIRLASDISASKLGACLDTSLLFASCLELMGLNPVIALGTEHAFVGVWLIDERFPVLTNDDPMDLRKRVDARDLVLFESTLVTNDSPVTFEQAKAHARELIAEDKEDEFVFVIDIKQGRARKIKPLSTIEEKPEEKSSDTDNTLSLPPIPPLPPVRADEQVISETPDTRIDAWQRKLLDLTKRNALLALKDRAVAIKIYCPDIGSMEDSLADGVSFKFLSAEESPLNDKERSEKTFRLQAGSNIHNEYALEQLNKNVLLANMPQKKLEQNAINLLRKAKNDLEEGGSNTLYLALGMLRWKENVEDDRSYRAPLILIPAELTRSSARAPVKVRQLPDEAPIFNMTLIEFLFTEHSIDLNQFRESLPEDESGVDVHLIWSTVRAAVAEQPGFEVVEELVLASFSFAKYLMWKDLKDRIDDLKENPFVKHLVDHPQDAYIQDASFILRDEVDEKIDPEKIFTPLNCDSSQLVAVEASGRPQDFVLEGPPGTGKSETIANIICHNLALGRKVLFVAEKMAALHVVYRRMEKVGLDHLCLELHSNKANKKAVLEQLKAATDKRETANSDGWVESVRVLKGKRDRLNSFVEALHKKSTYGISARDAIARDVRYKNNHSLVLGWPLGFESALVSTAAQLEEMLETAKLAALAYNDVSHLNADQFRILNARNWSNAWQSNVVDCLTRYKSALSDLYPSAVILASNFNIELSESTIMNVTRINSLGKLIDLAESNSLSYIVTKGVRELLDDLEKLRDMKKEFDQCINSIDHNISPETLAKTPVTEWVASYGKDKNGRFKRFFAKIKINSAAKKLGYVKFKDMKVLSELEKAVGLQASIIALAPPFEEDKIWQGWNTTHDSLNEAATRGRLAYKYLADSLGLTDDPGVVLSAVKSKLIDGRDFLHSSKLINQKNSFKKQWGVYAAEAAETVKLELNFDVNDHFEQVVPAIDELIVSAAKFKAWSEWLAAKEVAEGYHLTALTNGLEAQSILPVGAEEQVLTAFCRWVAPQLIDASDHLRQFKASTHEQLILEFREIDAEIAQTTSAYVSAIAAQTVPDPFAKDSPKEFGVLAREFQKKTRHKPVRSLFNEMGGSLLDLCPCMMMSPLSVAQFLPSDFNGFDLVVFDEASQMTTWDSVGAIARGKNVIVVGDPKQMPPTNFFGGTVDVDNPDEEDLESILDQALAARLPHLRLKGHYRSRHETLIAFSNSKYYENSLVTYPAADTKDSAVTLHRIEGVYSKGKGRNNPIEAKAVVGEIVKRLTDPERCKQSIGVVTLNTEQQRTIEDLLDDARRKYPQIETYFQSTESYDGVFVKNLESVQGDERDIIILSLSYGPTEIAGRTMSMNFGPLNKSGGERRLNVAITRATSEVLVFSSFDSSMIDLSRTSALAVEHLKHYLEFAEKGPIALAEQSTAAYGVDQFDSDFEQSVAWALRDKGWKVQTQIGVSKFRVDLGVIHPDLPGVYLAGIECDGATYHGSPSARDRDRVRHGILENLGWRLVRLWSTDYFQDSEEAISRIDHRLKDILAEDRSKAELKEKEDESVGVEIQGQPSVGNALQNIGSYVEESSSATDFDALTSPSNSVTGEYDHSRYFDDNYKEMLVDIAKGILEEKAGITLHELALDIANLHGLSRTSKKQLNHITDLITPWAGLKYGGNHKPVVWSRPEDVLDEIPWRGLDVFGDEREWRDIAYPEAKGLARLALQESSNDPVGFICDTFKLKRRNEKTLAEFQTWVDSIVSEIG
jgi:very-short-patch-repair endonuclease